MSSALDQENQELVRASGRVPPQSLEAEIAVLGCIVLDNSATFTAIENLRAEDFYRTPHQVRIEYLNEQLAA